jgi:DNA-binding transcriptional ArsR family regulator
VSDDAAAKLERLQALCEAIAHPARRQILLTIHLRGGETTAGAIAGRFAHAWPTTTRHLRVLEDAGVLTRKKVGREHRYRLDPAVLTPLLEWLQWFQVRSIYGQIGDPTGAPGHTTTEPAAEPATAPETAQRPRRTRRRR